ncbi:hypothetical protein OG585_53410 (plasmid) [Streptomyces sp. NBC_01340]|nr:hypothetical protein OG585_53410 [Streptomyces sp. NBC_01340]
MLVLLVLTGVLALEFGTARQIFSTGTRQERASMINADLREFIRS